MRMQNNHDGESSEFATVFWALDIAMAFRTLQTQAYWFLLAVVTSRSAADDVCPEDLDGELWDCGSWGSWKTVEFCDGLCGGGKAKTMRIRSCTNSGLSCTCIEEDTLECHVNCNWGVYNSKTERCDCHLGATGPCCIREETTQAKGDDTRILGTEMLRTLNGEVKKTCSGGEDYTAVEEHPSEYLVCSSESSRVLRCPESEVYDSFWNNCKEPDLWSTCNIETVQYARGYVNPRDGGQICDPNRNTDDWTTVFTCPSPTGQFALRDNDKFYFNCRDNRVTMKPCPFRTRFNPWTATCEAQRMHKDCRIHGHRYRAGDICPHNANMICDPAKSTTRWSKIFECPQPNGSFVHPEDNKKFYYCQEGAPLRLLSCQGHSIFLERLQRCWYPKEKHGCIIHGMFYEAGAEHPTEEHLYCDPPRSTTSWTSHIECDNGEHYFVSAQDPKSYFVCKSGQLQLHTCPGPSMFFEEIKGCGPIPQDSYCIISDAIYARGYINLRNRSQICDPDSDTVDWSALPRTPTHFGVPLPIVDDPRTTCVEPYGLQRVRSERSVFIQCSEWSPYLRHCRNGSIYIDYLKRCTYTTKVPARSRYHSRRVAQRNHRPGTEQPQILTWRLASRTPNPTLRSPLFQDSH
ncbi:uncharacterized protein LOC135398238 [Ornithodoros turicata]|uniref:uncharacterized protein LOC135398238 n=1 Tax=Ornithodoros turicata TaxID=34597 RepID=UPI003138D8C9